MEASPEHLPPGPFLEMFAAAPHRVPPMHMVRVEAGEFVMGIPGRELALLPSGVWEHLSEWAGLAGTMSDETQHIVTISQPYLIGTTEVTQAQWRAVMGFDTSGHDTCGADCPVEHLSWYDALLFCNTLSKLEGLRPCYLGLEVKAVADEVHVVQAQASWDPGCDGYRLPSEAEWEHAARAGSKTSFPGGWLTNLSCAQDPALDVVGWYCGNTEEQHPRPVRGKAPNAWGLHDVHGNVWEWVWDWHGAYPRGPVTDPVGPTDGEVRVDRGGAFDSPIEDCTSAVRGDLPPWAFDENQGFRVARSLGQEAAP
jgi:formylglycine-generating enzyme required for sulfatase activity